MSPDVMRQDGLDRHSLDRQGLERRRLTLAALLLCSGSLSPGVWAAPALLVPAYSTDILLRMLRQHWYLPVVANFRGEAESLYQTLAQMTPQIQAGTGVSPQHPAARAAWVKTMTAWTRLSAIPTGPLLQRRSLFAIDFQPPRQRLIDQALETLRREAPHPQPPNAAQMERIGSPAKGLPALELLLWHPAYAKADTAICALAAGIAADLRQEAPALEAAWLAEDQTEPTEEAVHAAFAEWVNQWLGAVEALRWRDIERPLLAGAADKTGYPRQLSGQTAQAWQSHWEALRDLSLTSAPPPVPGAGRISMALYLRGLGHIRVADALDAAVRRVDVALRGLHPQQPRLRLRAAAQALAQLKQLIETEVARVAQVSIGFSDADGD